MKSSKHLKAFLQAGLDLFLTPICFSCSSRLDRAQDVLCAQCMSQIHVLNIDSCPRCRSLLKDGKCENCDTGEIYYDAAYSAWLFEGPIQDVIHSFKYLSFRGLSKWLGEAMFQAYEEKAKLQSCDVITPVPLYYTRQKERGYNQSELLARYISQKSQVQYDALVKRTKYTISQTLLSKQQREHNLDGAFALRRNKEVSGKHILLIDDVFTTGTTANQIAILLKEKGAKRVSILTAGRAA